MSEPDPSTAVFKSPAKELSELLAAGEEQSHLWRPDELAAIFKHQVSAPLLVDLGGFDPGTAAQLKLLSEAQGLLLKSFADLIHHPSPPLQLLELVKNFAKANADHPGGGLPAEVASALYYLSIAAGLVHLDTRISKLSDPDLARGLAWARAQVWLDERAGRLLAEALAKVADHQKGVKP
jgi:hypothetical protein